MHTRVCEGQSLTKGTLLNCSFPTLLFETGSLIELASRLANKHAPPSAEGTDLHCYALLWMQVLGAGTQVMKSPLFDLDVN